MTKSLDHVCWKLAAKILGKPGTIVQKVRGASIGRLCKVIDVRDNISLVFEDGTSGFADFYKKAEL